MESVYVLGLDRTLDADARVERLVFEHQEKLARYVRRFIPQSDAALDVVQDVFLSAYKMLRTDPARPLSAGWLYKSATNHAISHLRKSKRRGETFGLEADSRSICAGRTLGGVARFASRPGGAGARTAGMRDAYDLCRLLVA